MTSYDTFWCPGAVEEARMLEGPLGEPWDGYAAALVETTIAGRRWLFAPRDPDTASPSTDARGAGTGSGLPAEPSAELQLPVTTALWIVTAWNPHPRFLSREENERRGRALEARLDALGFAHHPAVGRSDDWSAYEHSRAVIGPGRDQVLGVAEEFEQLAVFEITDVIACVDMAGEVRSSRRYDLQALEGAAPWP
jgi:hypothetical protein